MILPKQDDYKATNLGTRNKQSGSKSINHESQTMTVVMMAPVIGNQSERSKLALDQSESRISPMWPKWRQIAHEKPRDP